MKTGSKELIRDINSNIVLETIINQNPISRAALSKSLGLTKATISAIVQELINKKLVLEIGNDDTSLGRKPILLAFHKKAGYIVSIDLGVNTISALLTDLHGEEYQLKQVKAPSNTTMLIEVLIQLIQSMTSLAPETPYGMVGIAIAIHGAVNNNQVIFAPYYNLSGINFAGELEKIFHAPVYLENEANLSVIAEKTFAYDQPNIANISIHSGIGIGLILNHKLYSGFNGFAGEFGHTIVEIDGRPCPCGNHGCLEQYVSERVLLKECAERKGLDEITFLQFSELYQNGDPVACEIIQKFIKYMTVSVNNILNTYNPDIIVINSSFTAAFPELIQNIKDSLSCRLNCYQDISASSLKSNSILLGGACISIEKFLGIKYLRLHNIGTEF
jgi:Transcriptional regulator/sugar kinase